MLKDQEARRSPDGEESGARRPYETPVLEDLGALDLRTQGPMIPATDVAEGGSI